MTPIESTATGPALETRRSAPAPYAVPAERVIEALETDAAAGLNGAAAVERLARFGRNELAQAPPEPWWRRLARQFTDLLI